MKGGDRSLNEQLSSACLFTLQLASSEALQLSSLQIPALLFSFSSCSHSYFQPASSSASHNLFTNFDALVFTLASLGVTRSCLMFISRWTKITWRDTTTTIWPPNWMRRPLRHEDSEEWYKTRSIIASKKKSSNAFLCQCREWVDELTRTMKKTIDSPV